MTPLEYYQKKLETGEILEDPQQLKVMEKFQVIYEELIVSNEKTKSFLNVFKKNEPIKGLYLWGNVGIGKTFLLDTFYYCLPFENKLRIHFYSFMQQVHAELKALVGNKDPLKLIAREWGKKVKVICFDELMVTDIADAMLLGRLFEALFEQGICLIFTSNIPPDDLYKNGLQRERFLPAIELIKRNAEVIHLGIVDDYRIQYSKHAKFYWYPLTTANLEHMEALFAEFSQHQKISYEPLEICGRAIRIKKRTDETVWFDFLDICGVPRSQEDYLALVKQFHTILLSNLTAIEPQQKDLALGLIKLVDVVYDTRTRLIILAAQPIDKLYTKGPFLFEFQRTQSRLTEMQSVVS